MSLQKISVNIKAERDLGDIVLVKIEKDNSVWFCKRIQVLDPIGKCFEFPCYRWLDGNEVIIREGSGM